MSSEIDVDRWLTEIPDEVLAKVRRQAIVDFIDRQDQVSRKHSGESIMEDQVLAIREFGVEWSDWWERWDDCPDQIRLAWFERKKS